MTFYHYLQKNLTKSDEIEISSTRALSLVACRTVTYDGLLVANLDDIASLDGSALSCRLKDTYERTGTKMYKVLQSCRKTSKKDTAKLESDYVEVDNIWHFARCFISSKNTSGGDDSIEFLQALRHGTCSKAGENNKSK